jgi:MOSC domain-containing protein YiiM
LLAELKELGIGLLVAIALLILLSRFIGNNQPKTKPVSRGTDPAPQRHGHTSVGGPAPQINTDQFVGPALIHQLFITDSAAGKMHSVNAAEALAHRGLKGDSYCAGKGHWSESDNCEVTMIAQEDLDTITATTEVQVQQGQHRRNLVTRGIHLPSLAGKRFQIGSALFAYDRPRPPCQYIQQITEFGMVKALVFKSGICVRCFRSGVIRENDRIVLLDISPLDLIRRKISHVLGAFSNKRQSVGIKRTVPFT